MTSQVQLLLYCNAYIIYIIINGTLYVIINSNKWDDATLQRCNNYISPMALSYLPYTVHVYISKKVTSQHPFGYCNCNINRAILCRSNKDDPAPEETVPYMSPPQPSPLPYYRGGISPSRNIS